MAKKNSALSSESYKGVRDFYPADMAVENYIFDTWRKTCRSFGFEEYSASLLEPTELYKAKSSEEIVSEQTYSFTDRGGREVTLRPEMTPTVARMVAGKRRALAFPVRWFSIPNLFRYERPQRGRLREHWQLNADIFGSEGVDAEAEIIALASAVMRAFGAEDSDFIIKVGSRRMLGEHFVSLGLSEERAKALRILIDKKDKVKDFERQAEELAGAPFVFPSEASEDVTALLQKLRALRVENVVFDPALARGFEYYTGIVFEVFDTSPENPRSLFGGGRYDDLLSVFGVEPVPAVGFGMGDVTIRDFLDVHDLLPKSPAPADLYIATTSPALIGAAESLALHLRDRGSAVRVNLGGRKVGEQIKEADRAGIPYLLVVGEDEVASGTYKLKKLATGVEKTLRAEEIPAALLP